VKPPTAAQKRWREAVRGLGSVISGGPAVIHHPVGRTGKHNKVDIGHWWVIPLTDDEHKALHNGETFGFESKRAAEKFWFFDGVSPVLYGHPDRPAKREEGIHEAIMDYHT
jgi:hypothetical protein